MRKLTPAQWLRLDPARKPQPESFPVSSRDGGEVVASVNGSVLRRA